MKVKSSWKKQLVGLPKDAKPVHIHPRAYCVLRNALACATFAVPFMDGPSHGKNRMNIDGGYTLSGSELTARFEVGDWATLVYCASPTISTWYAVEPIPNL